MRLVIIESPFAGDVERNRHYALACLFDSLRRGEAPFASHLLYTQVLNDKVQADRVKGIEAGLCWARAAELTAVYTDLGVTAGMHEGIDHARKWGRPFEFRTIPGAVEGFEFRASLKLPGPKLP